MGIKKFIHKMLRVNTLEALLETQEKRIERLTNIILRENKFTKMKNELLKKEEEIRRVERSLEATIDRQHEEIEKLRIQLDHARNYKGQFYVFNPNKDKPRKVYYTYESALEDAKRVSKITNGEKIFVLKIVSSVRVTEEISDYAITPEEEIPF